MSSRYKYLNPACAWPFPEKKEQGPPKADARDLVEAYWDENHWGKCEDCKFFNRQWESDRREYTIGCDIVHGEKHAYTDCPGLEDLLNTTPEDDDE